MLDMIYIPLLSLFVLFVLTKLMGYRQVTQLSLYDYINGITIGSIAGEMIMGNDVIRALVAMIIYTIFILVISFFTKKYLGFRYFVEGKSLVLYDNDFIYMKSLDKAKIDLNELLMNCRINGYFDLNELDKIILETNGKFSFYPKTTSRPLKLSDLYKQITKENIPVILLLQGKVFEDNLKIINKNKEWLFNYLKVKGLKKEDIEVLYVDSNDNVKYYLRNKEINNYI